MILANATAEERAISTEEEARVEEIGAEISQIDKTIALLEEMKARATDNNEEEPVVEERAVAEEKAFANYLRGIVEERTDVNMDKGSNGDIIPVSIANKIIEKVYDICPILEGATRYNVKGKLEIPVYPVNASADITMAYATEFAELESTSGAFDTIELDGFLAGALTKVSKSLVNNAEFDLVSYVVNHMAYNIARFIEGELIHGTPSKITGISGATNVKTTASATAITTDELIELQGAVKDAYQQNAMWIMNPATRTVIRKLKDSNGRYLLQDDLTSPFGQTLLGKPVYCSDNMPSIATKNMTIIYGDMSGLAVNFHENVEVQVLRERFATQHVIGVVGWVELDSKIENHQKIAVLKQA